MTQYDREDYQGPSGDRSYPVGIEEPVELEVLMPVHNEAESIASTINEIYDELSAFVSLRFIVCEDGSVDDTKQVLREIATRVPARLFLYSERMGYSGAVRNGMMQIKAPYLLCLDSDGQCDPKDFRRFWELRKTEDVLMGWRVRRADNWMRRAASRSFYVLWKMLFRCSIHDPSCPFVLARREIIDALAPQMGAMQEGFWWEFSARAYRAGFSIRELEVNHRDRAAGVTQVYRLKKVPGIGRRHLLALFSILAETRQAKPEPVRETQAPTLEPDPSAE